MFDGIKELLFIYFFRHDYDAMAMLLLFFLCVCVLKEGIFQRYMLKHLYIK